MKKPNSVYIGIDPGWSGCLSLNTNQTIRFFDCPPKRSGMAIIIEQIYTKYHKTHNIVCYIESVHTIEPWSRQSGDKLMINLGIWLGCLASYGIATAEVVPKTWQKYTVNREYGKGTKDNSRNTAKELKSYYCFEKWDSGCPVYPEKAVGNNHNRSDALLISIFCERTKGGLCV